MTMLCRRITLLHCACYRKSWWCWLGKQTPCNNVRATKPEIFTSHHANRNLFLIKIIKEDGE